MTSLLENITRNMKRHLPTATSDILAILFLLFAIHSIALFELFVVLPSIYTNEAHASEDGKYTLYYFHVFMGLFIYVNVMISLYKIKATNTSTRGLLLPTLLKPNWKFCAVCECNSPPRSFHCFPCNSCILTRDHHCTFTGNCIGLHNRRFYITILLYMILAASYSCALNYDFMYHLFGSLSLSSIFSIMFPMMSWLFVRSDTLTSFQVFMCSLCIVGFLLCSGLFAYHMINILNGQIVYERTHNIHTYNLGWKENIAMVFGIKWKYAWFCPLIPSPIPSDGLAFVTKAQYENLKSM